MREEGLCVGGGGGGKACVYVCVLCAYTCT